MNPAVLNYLQSQQINQNNEMGSPINNPFDSGIRNAIESARISLDMTEKQQDKALRRSMLAFGNAYANEPRKKGFMANFGAVGRALSPAITAHDETEDLAFKENNALANQILAYNAADQEHQAKEEERAFRRQHAQEQLAEQKRYHDMMFNFRQGRGGSGNEDNFEPLNINGIEVFPIKTKTEYSAYTKDKKALGSILKEVEDLEKDYKKFRKDTSNNLLDPMAQGSYYTNTSKDFLGRFFDNKKMKEETANRQTLASKLNKFVISSERALKGGGVMGPRLIELFKEQKIYPNLEEDTPEIFESKLKMLKEEIENSYKAANLSLSNKVHIDPSQVSKIENLFNKKEDLDEENLDEELNEIDNIPTQASQTINEEGNELDDKIFIGKEGYPVVKMRNSNGDILEVPYNEALQAKESGLKFE